MAPSKATRSPDAAADTVIGFVLVTGISISLITVVMLMGAPALQEIQNRQQTDAMVSSYQRLDRGFTTLLSGAPAGTTPAWQVSMSQGSLSTQQGGEYVWGYAVNWTRFGNEYGLEFADFADGDAEITIYNDQQAFGSGDFVVQATRWEADTEAADQTISGTQLGTDSTTTKTLNWELAGHSTQLEFFDAEHSTDKPVAEAWFVDAGAVEWTVSGQDLTSLYYQNTAIIVDVDDGQVMQNAPRIRTPSDTGSGGESVFVRIVKIQGAVSMGGRSSGEVLLSSEGSHARLSSGDVHRVQLYPPTRTMEAWERRLTDESRDYTYELESDPGGLGTEEKFVFRDNSTLSGDLSTTFVETDVTMSMAGGG